MGKRKFIERNAIPTFFCKCHEAVQRTFLLEIQSDVQQRNKLFEFPYNKVSSNKTGQENKRPQEDKVVKESIEYNYSRESSVSRKRKYAHFSECIINKKPIAIDTLKQVVCEKENIETNSVLAQDINTLLESTTSKTVFTKSLLSPEILTLLKKKVEIAETENKTLKSQIKCLEEKVEKYSNVINKILNKDQHNALLKGTTRGSRWSDETITKGLQLQFACGSHGYKKITELAPFPSVRTLRERIQHIKFEPGILEDIFTYLELVVPYIPSRWRICGLV